MHLHGFNGTTCFYHIFVQMTKKAATLSNKLKPQFVPRKVFDED